VPSTAPDPVESRAPSSAERARLAIVFLMMTGLAMLLYGGVNGAAWITGASLTPASVDEPASTLRLALGGAGCLYVLVAIPTPVLFLMWQYRARSRQRWFGSGEATKISPGHSVLVWFLPVVSVVLPYVEMREMFRAEGELPTDRPLALGPWWASLLLGSVAGGVATVMMGGWTLRPRHSPATSALSALSNVLFAVAAFLAARFVAEFERRTARRRPAPEPAPGA
jgi:hypothetical protein